MLPGGGPQGALLGLFLFIVLVNDVGFNDQSNDNGDIITCKKRFKQFNELHLKYVDDLALAEAVPMKSQLNDVPPEARPQPDTLHKRTGHQILPEQSRVFNNLKKAEKYASDNLMKMYLPRFVFNNDEQEVLEETKLLGEVLRSDLSWGANTEYMVKRANRKLCCLKRLKKLGARRSDLIDVYIK